MCIKCIVTPIVFLVIVITALILIWKDVFAVSALPHSPVIINEIAWAGTEESSSREWIELFNGSSGAITLEGWTLAAQDGSPAIELSGVYPAGAYILLERTGEDTLPAIPAHVIYTGALENSGEYVLLRDADGIVQDSLDASDGWPGGDNAAKKTLARTNDGTWASGIAGGTPLVKNIFSLTPLPAKEAPDAAPKPEPDPPAIDPILENIGTQNPEEFSKDVAERTGTLKIFRAFLLLIGIGALVAISLLVWQNKFANRT